MKRFYFSILFFLIILNICLQQGCYTDMSETIQRNEVHSERSYIIQSVILSNDSAIYFNKDGGRYFYKSAGTKNYCAIIGLDSADNFVEINLNKILMLNVKWKESSGAVTTMGIMAQMPLISLGAIILNHFIGGNCPSLYLTKGNENQLEAQLLQGAIFSLSKRSEDFVFTCPDTSDSLLSIIIKNDNLNEKQYLDQISLFSFNEPENAKIFPDNRGNYYCVHNENNLYNSKFDKVFEKTGKPLINRDKTEIDSIYLELPDTENDTINLLLEGITLLWVNEAMQLLTSSRNVDLEKWYEKPEEYKQEIIKFVKLTADAGITRISVKQKVDSQFVESGQILPFNNVKAGKKLLRIKNLNKGIGSAKILITYPKLFFSINKINIADSLIKTEPSMMTLVSAIDHLGNKRTSTVSNIDSKYHVFFEKGDFVMLKFKKIQPNLSDKYAIRLTGYYEVYPDRYNVHTMNNTTDTNPEKLLIMIQNNFTESLKSIYCELP